MTTPIGFIIQPGQSIPDDVTEVADREGDAWYRTSRGHWHTDVTNADSCSNNPTCWDATGTLMDFGPLTVTAVREQPAAPEPHTPLTLITCGVCGVKSMTNHYCGEEQPAGESVSGLCEVGPDRVNCIVADVDHRRIYHGGSTLGDVATTLLAAEPESVDVLDLVRQYGHEGYESGVAAAQRDEEADDHHDGKARRLYDRIEAEVQRLRGDRDAAVDDAAYWKSVVAPPKPDPLVLSLPQVPEGAVALVGGKTGQRYERSRSAVVLWMHPREDVLLTLGELFSVEGSVTVVMAPPREPRTWPKLDTDEPDDRPAVVEVEGHGRWRLGDGEAGEIGHPDYYWSDDDAERDGHSLFDLRQLGDVTEVFDDKDGTR